MRRLPNVDLLLGQRHTQWANGKPRMGQRLMFVGSPSRGRIQFNDTEQGSQRAHNSSHVSRAGKTSQTGNPDPALAGTRADSHRNWPVMELTLGRARCRIRRAVSVNER